MSVRKIEKLTAIVLEEALDGLLAALARLRCVEIVQTPTDALLLKEYEASGEHAALAARLDAVMPVLARYDKRRRRPLASPPTQDRAAFCEQGRVQSAKRALAEAERLIAAKAELVANMERAQAEMRTVSPFLDWSRPLDLEGTASTAIELGALPAGTAPAAVLHAMENRAAVAQITCNDKTGLYLALIVYREEREQTMQALGEIGFTPAAFSRTDGTAKALFDRADRERARLAGEIARLDRQLEALALRLGELEIYSDMLHSALCADTYKSRFGATGSCVVITALCPCDCRTRLCAVLDATFAAYCFETPEQEQELPVSVATPRLLCPFAALFDTDRPPVCRKFDPTWLFALCYCLCFGLFFADAGYGLCLALGTFAICKLLYLPRRFAQVGALLGCCGVGSLLCGALTGRYFGTVYDTLAPLPAGVGEVLGAMDAVQHPLAPLHLVGLLTLLYLTLVLAVRCCALLHARRFGGALVLCPYLLSFAGACTLLLFALVPWFVGLGVLLLGLVLAFLVPMRGEGDLRAKVKRGLGGLAHFGAYGVMLCRYGRVLTLGGAAAALGAVLYLLPRMAQLPLVGLALMIGTVALALAPSNGLARLAAWAHAHGVPYADACARFSLTVPPMLDPLLPTERYGIDATPIRKKHEVVSDDRT